MEESTEPEEEQKPLWDVFENNPVQEKTGSMEEFKIIEFLVKVIKVLSYVVSFTVILGAAGISKGTLLFMTSQIASNQTRPYCNRKIEPTAQFVVQIPLLERTAWIWIIMFTYFVPELATFLRSVRMCLFKQRTMPNVMDFASCFITESLSPIGSAILVFCILPEMDVVKGAMLTNAVCFVPAVIGFFSRNPAEDSNNYKMVFDILSIVSQATVFVVWPLIEGKPFMWLIPLSVILISTGWWENYVSENSPIKFIKNLGATKKHFNNNRYFIYMFVSIWKCIVFFVTTIVIIAIKENRVDFLFENFMEAFEEHYIAITEIKPISADFEISDALAIIGTHLEKSSNLTPVWVFLINILSSYICYAFAKFACKISIQGFGYAFPVNLAVPFTVSMLIIFCGEFNGNECAFADTIPPEHTWIWLLWLFSQSWITIHLWHPHCEKLARTEKLYVKPMYDAFFIDQSIAMNRRRDDKKEESKVTKGKKEESKVTEDKIEESEVTEDTKDNAKNDDSVTKIYACATMWHEIEDEIIDFLKSILRLDKDQFPKRFVREELGEIVNDYYELETHIFFDDAFVSDKKDDRYGMVNKHVLWMVDLLDKASLAVHGTATPIGSPKKIVTPYGGQLVWTLPGESKLIVHLKDKARIRNKKRWSQVMYMYYLLGFKLTIETKYTEIHKRDVVFENTYLLALDGDVDFQPEAVHLLVELMKKNEKVGAACGRIHPTGSGAMVWYQMFEYAVGHWLQKATEHIIGCVLCSPGCFSLFRASALADDRVMNKYTTKAENAIHYVQYDQGEDRWLCTLLLQAGWRVEYAAASDAFTHCPEGFNEFYNQRRRWMPSTTANILDLLMDYKRVVKNNPHISKIYILYQIVLMVGTILGPGTIFLMLVGSFVAAFNMGQWSSFIWNAVPILIFMGVCIVFDSEIQLLFAGIISAIYGLVMMAVLVGVMLQIASDGIMAPSSLFFFCVAGEMIIAAILHPKEMNCLLYGVVYYVTVPSMYMLLVIYSVFNLNNVSWGTREDTVVSKSQELKVEEIKKEVTMKDKIFAVFGAGNDKDNGGTFEFSIAGLAKCMFCTHRKKTDEEMQLIGVSENVKELSEILTQRLDRIERVVRQDLDSRDSDLINQNQSIPPSESEGSIADFKRKISFEFKPDSKRWLEDERLGYEETDFIDKEEKMFWEGLLATYLYPYEDNKVEVESKLKKLRDTTVMAFFMLNAIFVLVVFLLTLNKDLLHVNWPLNVKVNFTYREDVTEIEMYKTYLELEPIGFVFLIFFALLLVIQFTAMLFHRFGTLLQILSNTSLKTAEKKNLTDKQNFKNNPVKYIKEHSEMIGAEEGDVSAPDRRKTIKDLVGGSRLKNPKVTNMRSALKLRTTENYIAKTNMQGRKSMAMYLNKRLSHVRFNEPTRQRYIPNRGFKSNALEEE